MHILKNNKVEVSFNEKGTLCGIHDKKTKRKYITEKDFSGLFRIMSSDGNWQGRHGDSKDQDNVSVISESPERLKIVYEKISFAPRKVDFDFNMSSSGVTKRNIERTGKPKDIKCLVEISLKDSRLVMSLKVENNSEDEISDVLFPILSGFGSETKDMDITWPVQTQINKRIIKSPFLNLGSDNHKEWFHERRYIHSRYPHELVTSWVDFSDKNGGISIDIREEDPGVFDFCIEKVIRKDPSGIRENNRQALFMSCQYYPGIPSGGNWVSPEIILDIHDSTWHKAAKSHRNWLETVMKRPDVPDNFKTSLGWHFYLMKLQDGNEVRDFDDLEHMAQASLDAGIDNIMLFGLYNDGHDNDYDMTYIPNEDWGGPEKFTEQVEKLNKKNVRVIPFFNGTLMDSRLLNDDIKLLDMCVLGRTGCRYGGQDWSRPCFDFPQTSYKGYSMARNNMNFEVCITGKPGKKWFLDTVRRLSQEYRTGNIQLDQLAHKAFVCYDKTHGHSSPATAYTKDMKSLMTELRQELREYNPEGLVIGEGFSDITASYCDGFWNWNQLDNPQVIKYSVPWLNFSTQIDALDYEQANFAFANGLLFDLKIEGGVGILSDFPAFQKHLKNLSLLKKALIDSMGKGDFEDEEGLLITGSKSVAGKKYLCSETGKGCVVIANLANTPARAVADIQDVTKNMGITDYEGNRKSYSCGDEIFLKPYEVKAIEFSFR